MKKHFGYLGLAMLCSGFVGGAFVKSAQADEPYCREYTQTFTIAGQVQTGYGTACLQPDGAWKIVSQNEDTEQDNTHINQIYYVIEGTDVYIMPRKGRHFPYWQPPMYHPHPSHHPSHHFERQPF